MIDEVLTILKNKLNSHFKILTATPDDKVVFPDSSKADAITFSLNTVSLVLTNIEEEKIFRQAGFKEGVVKNGIRTGPVPAISINLKLLFVSRFADYTQSLKFLSLIISFFQKLPLLTPHNTPELPSALSFLKIELITQAQAQQNEVWTGLRTAYLPSVLYKVGVLLFEDTTGSLPATAVQETSLTTRNL